MANKHIQIKSFNYSDSGCQIMSKNEFMIDWPFVYMIHDKKNIYIGETQQLVSRTYQHLGNKDIGNISNKATIETIFCREFNKSAILDIEQNLIRHMKADGTFDVQNGNNGQYHDYYNRFYYHNEIFYEIWNELFKRKFVSKTISEIRDSDVFKYSPYTAMNDEQFEISKEILSSMCASLAFNDGAKNISIVDGSAGTGKTILALTMLYHLLDCINGFKSSAEDEENDHVIDYYKMQLSKMFLKNGIRKIGFVVPMGSLRQTISKVMKTCGLFDIDVIGPFDVAKKNYDILFVDESHRLTGNINSGVTFNSFRNLASRLGLNCETTNQLEFVLKSARFVVLFYDEMQSVKNVDITKEEYQNTIKAYGNPSYYHLTSQMRVLGGGDYIKFVDNLLDCKLANKKYQFKGYKLKHFTDIQKMVDSIKDLDKKEHLCRVVSGYAYEWKQPRNDYNFKKDNKIFDIEIGSTKLIWNTTEKGWVISPNAVNEVGCVHTTQGYDINVAGVIFGPEIDYDPVQKRITVDKNLVKDAGAKHGTSVDECYKFVLNAYKVLLKRGINGTFIYCCNKNLRNYFSKFIKTE